MFSKRKQFFEKTKGALLAMKKLKYPFIIGLLSVALAACGSNDASDSADKKEDSKTAQTEEQQKQTKEQEKQMKEMQEKLEKQQVDEKKTVALVNDEKILGSEYNQVLQTSQMQMQQMGQDPTTKDAAKQVKDQTIDSLVGQTLLIQDATEKGYKASEDEINKQIEDAKKQYDSEKEFNNVLKQAGLNMDQLKEQLGESIQYNKYVEKEIKAEEVTDKEVKEYYDQYAKQAESAGSEQQQQLPKYEEIKDQIKGQLEQQKKQEKVGEQVEKLKKEAKVDVKI
jgi:SurA N-terminal domain